MTLDWWTLGLEAVNVLILIWLLQHVFWRPLAGIIAKRQADTQALLADVSDKQSQIDAALSDIETTRAGFADERDKLLADARAEAEKAKTNALEAAKAKAAELRRAAQIAIEREKATAAAQRRDQAVDLAVQIASRLAARLNGEAVDAAFQSWLLDGIAKMSDEGRQEITDAKVALELVSAAPLKAPEKAKLTKALTKALTTAFGAKRDITYKIDPALIAGYELHGPHFTLRNSWQADLDTISKALRDEA
jgi:F-type H+-transporting ATPase subunit b